MTSLGKGIPALSIVMARKMPNQPKASNSERTMSIAVVSIPDSTGVFPPFCDCTNGWYECRPTQPGILTHFDQNHERLPGMGIDIRESIIVAAAWLVNGGNVHAGSLTTMAAQSSPFGRWSMS